MNNKIGIGLITCNREKMFEQCAASIPEVENFVIVNDGQPYSSSSYPQQKFELIQHKKNRGVGISKNDAITYLMKKNCRHIFLMEDDIRIVDPKIFESYIHASEVTGLHHMNFAYHGPENKDENGNAMPRTTVKYSENVEIALTRHIFGALSYYRSELIEKIGLIDPRYKNAWEHVDHTYEIIKAGHHPPFWWFADVAESFKAVVDIDPLRNQSVIRKKYLLYRINNKFFTLYYKWKHGHKPWEVEDPSEEKVLKILEEIRQKYGKSLTK